jgi:hypothetical protein
MIHVPDVAATINWYQNVGFTVLDTYGDGGDGLGFAILHNSSQPDSCRPLDGALYLITKQYVVEG